MHYSEIDKDQGIGDIHVQSVNGRGSRIVYFPDLEAVDGTDYLVPCSPDRPGREHLRLTEKQTREAAEKLNAIVEAWDFEDDDFGK